MILGNEYLAIPIRKEATSNTHPILLKSDDVMETDSDVSMASASSFIPATSAFARPHLSEHTQLFRHPFLDQQDPINDFSMKSPTSPPFSLSSGIPGIPGGGNLNFSFAGAAISTATTSTSTECKQVFLPSFNHSTMRTLANTPIAFQNGSGMAIGMMGNSTVGRPIGIMQSRFLLQTGQGSSSLFISPIAPSNQLGPCAMLSPPLIASVVKSEPSTTGAKRAGKTAMTVSFQEVAPSNKLGSRPVLSRLNAPVVKSRPPTADLTKSADMVNAIPLPTAFAKKSPSANSTFPAPVTAVSAKSGTGKKTRRFQRWTDEEDALLKKALKVEGKPPYQWHRIGEKYFNNSRTGVQCKSRWCKALQPSIVKGKWKPGEDALIIKCREDGLKWADIADLLPGRIGEHVRDRFVNILDPTLKKTPWTKEEDTILFREQKKEGNKWTLISKSIPGRSENGVKNRWHNLKVSRRRRMRALMVRTSASATASVSDSARLIPLGQINRIENKQQSKEAESKTIGV